MLDDAVGFRPSAMPGRFVIETMRDSLAWELVVEPDELEQRLIVVTAYEVQ